MDEFENNVDLDEVAQNEPPHLDIHCLPSSIWILNMIHLGLKIFWKFADENFVVCFLVVKDLSTLERIYIFTYIKLERVYQQSKDLDNETNGWMGMGRWGASVFLWKTFLVYNRFCKINSKNLLEARQKKKEIRETKVKGGSVYLVCSYAVILYCGSSHANTTLSPPNPHPSHLRLPPPPPKKKKKNKKKHCHLEPASAELICQLIRNQNKTIHNYYQIHCDRLAFLYLTSSLSLNSKSLKEKYEKYDLQDMTKEQPYPRHSY